MSKLYRSLLWSGLVVAGVAACGDDVTVQPPPPPPPATVHSVSVAPNPGNIAPNGTLQMIASVNADAGVATTVTWSSSNSAVVSVSATGLATAIAAAVPGTSVAIQACATAAPGVCGQATVTVSAVQTPTVTQVNVTPPTAGLVVGQTITPTAAVIGTNNPAQTVTWSLATPGTIVSVNATSGLITALANGTAVVRACSTVNTAVCGSIAVTVTTPSPASVQVLTVNWVPPTGPTVCTQGPGPSVPVVLTNVRCQIEVTVQVNSGDQQLSRVDVLIDGQVMASQTFGTTGPAPETAPISADVTLSFNTNQVRRNNGVLVPVVTNGNGALTAQLFVIGSSTPIASNAIPIVLNNTDAIVALGTTGAITGVTLVPNTPTPTFTDGAGNVWFTGPATLTGVQYISFSEKVPTSIPLTSNICGTSNSNTVTGAAATGVTVSAVFNCTGVQGGVFLTGFGAITYTPPLNGPDGTPLTPPTAFSNVGGGFNVAGDLRWNLITPAVPAQTFITTFIDNLGPALVVGNVAFQDAFDEDWINATYNFIAAGDVSASDAGSGVAGSVTANLFTTVCTTTVVVNGADPALTGPTLTSNSTGGRRICARAVDNVGNVSISGPSNFFGIDFLNPVVRMAGSTTATPSMAPFTTISVSTVANTTIYPTASFTLERWGMEALDDRAGFDLNLAVTQYPSLQTLVRSLASGNTSCSLFDPLITPGANGLGVPLSDNFVRNTILAPLDCAAPGNLGGVGYYTWTGLVTDRAGNSASPVPGTRNFAYDPGAPNITGLGYASTLYVGGQPAVFSISANDDLEILKAALGLNYTGMPAPGVGLLYPEGTLTILDAAGNPLLPWTTGTGALPITAVLNAAPITLPYFVARVDESCIFNANPYPSCDVTTNGLGSRPNDPADYNINLNGGGTLSNAQKGPNAVLANVADITGRESLTGISAPFLASQFTAMAQPWNTGTILSPVPANPFQWTGAVIAGPVAQAVNRVNSSIVLPFFDAVNLFRLNTVTGQWTFCRAFPAPVPNDNGFDRTYTYNLPLPLGTVASPNACDALTGNWKAMGLKNGAGLFTGGF
jgi:hypothetical protein